MAGLMFDSDDPAVLSNPLFAGSLVATYADLMTPAIVSEFVGRLVVIDRGHGDPMSLAHVVDIESGAVSVAAGAAKIKQWNAEGRGHIAAYVDRADWDAVLSACLPVKPYMWIATLDGTLNPSGKWPTAVQFGSASTIGIHVDVSIVYDETWVPIAAPASSTAVRNAQGLSTQLTSLAASLASAVKAL
jgi:hypothetical protein